MPSTSAAAPIPTIAVSGEGDRLALEGVLDIRTLESATAALQRQVKQKKLHALDLGNLLELDTPGALLLRGLAGEGVELTRVRAEHKALLDIGGSLKLKPLPKS